MATPDTDLALPSDCGLAQLFGFDTARYSTGKHRTGARETMQVKATIVCAILLVSVVYIFSGSLAAQDNPSPSDLPTLEIKIGRIEPGALPESLTLSPDRKRVAFFRKLPDKKWTLVVDDRQGKPFDNVGKMNPLFSADSQHVAYVAEKNGRKHVVVDDLEGNGYDSVGGVTFSPDNKHIAYMAEEDGERVVVVDGAEQPLRFDGLHASGPVFSPDSKHLGYAAKRGLKWLVVIDGKQGKEYDGAAGPVFSPDSRHWAHFAKREEKSLIILDGIESREYDGVLRDTTLIFTTPYTVEAIMHRELQIFRVALSNLMQGK